MITRTPLRVSLAGGGSDLPAFAREHGGAVVSLAIDLSMYVAVHERVGRSGYRVAYSRVEEVMDLAAIEHGIVRAALTGREVGPCEVVTVCDAPAGTGLGSSAAVAVGLTRALLPSVIDPELLATLAWKLEAKALGHEEVGLQDHAAAAHGHLRLYEFRPGSARPTTASPPLLSTAGLLDLAQRLWLVPTGGQRDADVILDRIRADAAEKPTQTLLALLRDLAYALAESLSKGDLEAVREALRTGWALKRELAGVTNPAVDALYEEALACGAKAGKLLGAGGLGFLLLYVEPEDWAQVSEGLPVPMIPVVPSFDGSRVVYSG